MAPSPRRTNQGINLKRNHCLYDTGLWVDPLGHPAWQFIHGAAVGDPRSCVYLTAGDQAQDASEVGGNGVSAGVEGEFAAVKKRVIKQHGLFGDSDVDDPTRKSCEPECSGHGAWMTSGIKDYLGAWFVRQAFDDRNAWVVLLHKEAAILVQLQKGDGRSREAGKLEDGEADGACADDQYIVSRA